MPSIIRPRRKALIRRALLGTALSLVASLIAPLPTDVASPVVTAQASGEYVQTYAADCVTPQTVFNLGDTVCAQAGGYHFDPASIYRYRRFQWAAPSQAVARTLTVKYDPQGDKYVIPTSGTFAQPGTWYVRTISMDGERQVLAKFTVRDPFKRWANLTLAKSGPFEVLPEERVKYTVTFSNFGPDYAEQVELYEEVPTNMVFVGLKQVDGQLVECKTPARGGTGYSYCYVRGLKMDESITLDFYYQVDPYVRLGTVCSSYTKVTSYMEDLDTNDNALTTDVKVKEADKGDTTGETGG